MKTRPYINRSVRQLDLLAHQSRTDADILSAVRTELRFRSTAEAYLLGCIVEQMLEEIEGRTFGDPAFPRPRPDDSEIVIRMRMEIGRLKQRIRDQDEMIGDLRRRLHGSGSTVLYRKVGLHPDCPDHVFEAARRSHLKASHPDLRPPGERFSATKHFKEIMDVFEKLCAERSAQGPDRDAPGTTRPEHP